MAGMRDSAWTDCFSVLTVVSGGISRERRSESASVGAVMLRVMRLSGILATLSFALWGSFVQTSCRDGRPSKGLERR